MAAKLVNNVKIAILNTGSGALQLGSAIEGYRGVEALSNGEVYSYSIRQNAAFEYGRGTYFSSGNQFLRQPNFSSDGGSAINLQPGAQVAFVALAEDITSPQSLYPLSGEGPPPNDIGDVGQFYRDIASDAQLEYGPKTETGWGTPRPLAGRPGGSNATYSSLSDLSAQVVPDGTDLIWIANQAESYVRDTAVDQDYVDAHPDTSGLDGNGNGFRRADPLRSDLAGDDGAALTGYKPSGGIRKSLAEFLLSLRRTVSYLTLGSAITALGNGVVHLAPGTYTAATIPSRTNGLIGSGIGAAVINPTSATGIALTSTANGGGWDFAVVENLSVVGTGTRQGIGYQFGPTSYTAGAEYTGRTVFDRVGFSNHDKCINRPWGSIGLYTRNCQFGSANYHLFVTANVGVGGGGSGDVMHAGTAFLVGDNCQGAQIASNYIDGRSVIGTCQFNQRDRILEGIPGWCHYFRNCNSAGGFPHFLIDGEYIENNYTATSVTTPDGNTRAPKYLYALNTTSIVISNSCPGPMVLDGSNVTTIGCDLTNVVNCELTNNATLAHHMARSFNSQVDGLTYSIGAVLNETSLAAPCYAMPVPSGFGAGGGTVLFVKNAQSPIAFTGSVLRNTTTVAGSALPGMDKVQRLTIDNGQTLLPTTSVTLPANKYFVVKYVARKVSGPTVSVQISGLYTFGRQMAISSTTLRTYTQILKAESVDRTSSLYHFNGGATSVVEIGGISIVAFDTMQEALAYANSGLIAQEPRAAITLAAYTAATAFDPATATLADVANTLATLIDENQKGRLLT